MSLDETLSQDIKTAIELNLFVNSIVEGASDDKYPKLKSNQFGDPANKAFPCDTSEHCRAAIVYLAKYYNNPAVGGVTAEYSKEKFRSVHNRIIALSKKFGIEHKGCSICKKSKASDTEKGGLEDMTEELTEEVVEDTEATEETEEVAAEESAETEEEVVEASEEDTEEEETEATEDAEATEETEEETEEVVAEEEVSEEEVVEASAPTMLSRLTDLGSALSDLISSLETAEASDEETVEEASELDMLAEELAEAKEKLQVYEALDLGNRRLSELATAGVTFADEDTREKAMRIGKMSDEDFQSYSADLIAVAGRNTNTSDNTDEEEVEEAEASDESSGVEIPPFFLPNVASPQEIEDKDKYKKMYKK